MTFRIGDSGLIGGRWSQEGEYLVSGSDDHRLFIWSAYDKFAVRKILDTGTYQSTLKIVSDQKATWETFSPQSSCHIQTTPKSFPVPEIVSSNSPKWNTLLNDMPPDPLKGHGTVILT